VVAHACNPSYLGDEVGGSWFEVNLGKSTRPHLKYVEWGASDQRMYTHASKCKNDKIKLKKFKK
jgi:hypothetical protein